MKTKLKSKLFYLIAAFVLLLVSIFHTLGMLNRSGDQELNAIFHQMSNFKFQSELMSFSLMNVFDSLGLAMSLFLLTIFGLNLSLLGEQARLLKKISMVNLLAMIFLTILFYYFQVLPPFVSFLFLSILYGAAYIQLHIEVRKSDSLKTDH